MTVSGVPGGMTGVGEAVGDFGVTTAGTTGPGVMSVLDVMTVVMTGPGAMSGRATTVRAMTVRVVNVRAVRSVVTGGVMSDRGVMTVPPDTAGTATAIGTVIGTGLDVTGTTGAMTRGAGGDRTAARAAGVVGAMTGAVAAVAGASGATTVVGTGTGTVGASVAVALGSGTRTGSRCGGCRSMRT